VGWSARAKLASREVTVPGFVQMSSLERALRIDQQKLRELNPALLRAVWTDTDTCQRRITCGLPMDGDKWTSDLLAARLSPNEFFAGSLSHADIACAEATQVASVADQYGVSRSARASQPHADKRQAQSRPRDQSTRIHCGHSGGCRRAPAGSIAVGRPATTATVAANTSASAAHSGGTSVTSGIGVSQRCAVSGSAASADAVATAAAANGEAGTSILNGLVAGSTGTIAGGAGVGGRSERARDRVLRTPGAAVRAATGHTKRQRGTPPRHHFLAVRRLRCANRRVLLRTLPQICMTEGQLLKLNGIRNRDFIFEGQQLLVTATPPSAVASTGGPSTGYRRQQRPVYLLQRHLKVARQGLPWRAQPYRAWACPRAANWSLRTRYVACAGCSRRRGASRRGGTRKR